MVAAARVRKELSMIAKDISWLWRAAYNCAVEGCSKWEQAEDQLSDLFDVSREVGRAVLSCWNSVVILLQLLEAYCEETPMVIDAELHQHVVITSFAAVSGRGKSCPTIVLLTIFREPKYLPPVEHCPNADQSM
jgi:hypothetical protein